ncbi:MAG: curli production assembly protein CsgG [Acidobacteria bacterium]|nr:curli production assembly protein CsgG [Acidobacteriota bacterium]
MKKVLCACALFVSVVALASAAPAKKRVAILNFDFGTVHRWWSGDWDIGKGIADLVVTELVKDGTYSVIERKALDAILAEQNFSNSNRADPTTAAKIGKMLGVNAIVVGSITQFGTEDKGFKLGGIGGRFGGFGGGKVGTSKGVANVVIDARMVDVNTGEILAVATGKGESSRSGLLLEGVGAGGGGFGAGGIDMGSKNFQETIIGEATRAAVQNLSKEVVTASGKIVAAKVEVRGLVADVAGGEVILNVGSSHGVAVGDRLKIVRVARTVKDPATGKVLREVTEDVGEVEITQADEGSASGKVVSGGDLQVGDVVRSQ